jgi:hypothetical protein
MIYAASSFIILGINPRSVPIFRGRDIRIVQSALH